MAKIGTLGKLKCILKRWHSSSRLSHRPTPPPTRTEDDRTWRNNNISSSKSFRGDVKEIPAGYCPVYVGKSRRRYIVSSSITSHPLFRNLLERSESDEGSVVGCEVVLFEHLLWMLDNGDPQPEESLDDDELVEYYAC